MNFYGRLRTKFVELVRENGWAEEQVQSVHTAVLTATEAIGRPERGDYPILTGKEVMMETTFQSQKGQAFTDQPGVFYGTLKDVLELPLSCNFERAVFISAFNAVLCALGTIEHTVHCRDDEPKRCAAHMSAYIREHYGEPKIAFIGFQPGMISELSKTFEMRVTDLNPENIGRKKAGVLIEDARHTADMIAWADIIVATGSTIVNDTLRTLMGKKPLLLYGVSAAGAAYVGDIPRYCPFSH